jgi:hypothetical protein
MSMAQPMRCAGATTAYNAAASKQPERALHRLEAETRALEIEEGEDASG